ncbi:signal recognition particle 72 kDa subunit [Heterostelium album PN500]|uniref:Signal recognition particle subunit SRP72 n=1 Tax=Heterostelium pallidum (strain ATCC 26659 / Pp 5 / PN500) TaxID=670386 RepID=D3B6U5_HETP5|nr:signal recognition particle 72 kDa subunit [Heterostelium album PN500]EFA83065.1 signal recognition particle 72 kDa subunit [Heterostelium album PN500]|eukprot:XP_020435182.1 signal recognition particle 72 kDa subunit [Heterostelium album PN500]
MSNKEQPVDQLFKELDENIQQSQYKKALRVFLLINKADVEAFQCKVICLMFNSSFQEALDCLKNAASPSTQSEPMLFEKAYCLYSLAKYNEALELIDKLKQQKTLRVQELEAQIYYKLEKYQKTIAIYEALLKEPGYQSDSGEFLTNLCAAYIDAGKIQECQDLINKNKSLMSKTYEFAFNAACLALYKKDIKTAETQLKLAKKVCVETLKKDGFSEEEIQEEASSVIVQIGYCQQLSGNMEEALESYQSIIDLSIGDSASLIALNNSVAIRSATSGTEKEDYQTSLDQIKSIITEQTENKLTTAQKCTVNFNHISLMLHLKKVGQCEEMVRSLKAKYKDSTQFTAELNEDLDLIVATLLTKDKKWREAEEILKSLESSVQSKPGIVATMVALYEKSGDMEKAVSCLDTLITSLENKKSKTEKEEDSYISLLKLNGNFNMKHLKYKEAASCYEKILKINANDLFALPSFIVATAHFDPTIAQKYEGKLPPLKFNDKIDVDAIDKLGLSFDKNEKAAATTSTTNVTAAKKSNEKAKAPVVPVQPKKPKRLPKNYNPDVKPDPERWLPKWQRSSNRGKRGPKGKKQDTLSRGPQGVVSQQQASQLAASSTSAPKFEQPAQQAAANKPRNINKKKKGKK